MTNDQKESRAKKIPDSKLQKIHKPKAAFEMPCYISQCKGYLRIVGTRMAICVVGSAETRYATHLVLMLSCQSCSVQGDVFLAL